MTFFIFLSYVCTGIVKFICKLFARDMCRNFKLRACGKKSFCVFRTRDQRKVKCFLPGRRLFTKTGKHLMSDQEICIPTAREALQPIYVTEITKNFPSDILMPFASARHELGEMNFLSSGNLDEDFLGDSQISVVSEENAITEIFAWVYSMDITDEQNIPDEYSMSSVREN